MTCFTFTALKMNGCKTIFVVLLVKENKTTQNARKIIVFDVYAQYFRKIP